MHFFLSLLLSLGLVFGFTPTLAYADESITELEKSTSTINEEPEITEGSSPTGNWGQFGYSMNLSPDIANAWFEGTSNMEIDDHQNVDGIELQRVANGSTGFWKYVVYNQWFKYPDKIKLDSIIPISANTALNKDVDFIMWFQKNANDSKHFYNPGDIITYYGGYGTDVGPDYVAKSIYSIDAVWAIWTKSDEQYFYDGQPHTPMVQYEYNYTSGTPGENAVDFLTTVKEQLDKTISVTVTGDAEDYYEEQMSTIPDIISLTHGEQTNAGNYNFKCAVDYYGADGTEIDNIVNSPSTEAQLTIDPRNVKFNYTIYKDYTGQPITATYTSTKDGYVNAINETGIVTVETAQNETGNGLMEGDYIVFNTTASGILPGTYHADNNNISYTIYNSVGEDVTQNYNVTFDFTLIIEGEVPEPPDTIIPPADIEPEPENPPTVEPEPSPNEPIIDEPITEEPNNTELNTPNKPITPKPVETNLPQTGDNDYVWFFAILCGLGTIGLFIARRFE